MAGAWTISTGFVSHATAKALGTSITGAAAIIVTAGTNVEVLGFALSKSVASEDALNIYAGDGAVTHALVRNVRFDRSMRIWKTYHPPYPVLNGLKAVLDFDVDGGGSGNASAAIYYRRLD